MLRKCTLNCNQSFVIALSHQEEATFFCPAPPSGRRRKGWCLFENCPLKTDKHITLVLQGVSAAGNGSLEGRPLGDARWWMCHCTVFTPRFYLRDSSVSEGAWCRHTSFYRSVTTGFSVSVSHLRWWVSVLGSSNCMLGHLFCSLIHAAFSLVTERMADTLARPASESIPCFLTLTLWPQFSDLLSGLRGTSLTFFQR